MSILSTAKKWVTSNLFYKNFTIAVTFCVCFPTIWVKGIIFGPLLTKLIRRVKLTLKEVFIMKKSIVALVLLLLGSIITFGVGGCSQDMQNQKQEPTENLDDGFDGAYFITDESYESYVRNCAVQVGADEEWVSEVLNGGDGGQWNYMIRPPRWFWCAIADNQITVSKIGDTVYDISICENAYRGNSVAKTVSFWFSGDILHLSDNDETLEYKKDGSYKRAVTGEVALGAPQNITVQSGGEGLNFVTFKWNYQSDYGRIGAAVEIKTAGLQEYKPLGKIERVYMNEFTVQLDESNFEAGENQVRIYHVGGPSVTNDHSVIVRKNSNYATYRVTVNGDGSVTVQK